MVLLDGGRTGELAVGRVPGFCAMYAAVVSPITLAVSPEVGRATGVIGRVPQVGPASGRSAPVSRGPVSPVPVSVPASTPVSTTGTSMGEPVSVPASAGGLTTGSEPQAPSEALSSAIARLRIRVMKGFLR